MLKNIIKNIQNALTDQDRLPQYRGDSNLMRGHCYVASEVLYHMYGKALGFRPKRIKHEGSSHWFLYSSKDNKIIDITASQFKTSVPYQLAVGCGFLTKTQQKN